MGCCTSSPHSKRRYRDPADLDEEYVDGDTLNRKVREFGFFRPGSGVQIPNDIDGLPSTHLLGPSLATNPDILLYDAEIDNGRAWRCIRPIIIGWICPCTWAVMAARGICFCLSTCTCDEAACWVRKEYSTRTYYRVYPNRIQINDPVVRIPWGCFGCGSWSSDVVISHPFDRGAFGFRRVNCGVVNKCCGIWPVYGDVVARQRCPCNGPLWADGRGWWCDEWICDVCFCTYRYYGLADGDECAFASSIALQAYFEGRRISKADMEKCIEYWRNNLSLYHDPVNRHRHVMCEPYYIPCPLHCSRFYKNCCNCDRKIPYEDYADRTKELKEMYKRYKDLREKQVHRYETFKGPVYHGTVCRTLGCSRVFGRKGLLFFTEGIYEPNTMGCCYKGLQLKKGDPFPPFPYPDIDDDNDASKILQTVLGNPPSNVVYRRWVRNNETGKYEIMTYPEPENYDTNGGAEEPLQSDVIAVAAASDFDDDKGCSALLKNDPMANNSSISSADVTSASLLGGSGSLIASPEDKPMLSVSSSR